MSIFGSEASIKGAHITFYVTDLERSRVAYEIILGIPPTYSLENEYGFVLAQGISVNIEKSKVTPIVQNTFLTLAVTNIDAAFGRFAERGIKIVSNPKRAADGHAVIGVVADDDGNRIVFAE